MEKALGEDSQEAKGNRISREAGVILGIRSSYQLEEEGGVLILNYV